MGEYITSMFPDLHPFPSPLNWLKKTAVMARRRKFRFATEPEVAGVHATRRSKTMEQADNRKGRTWVFGNGGSTAVKESFQKRRMLR